MDSFDPSVDLYAIVGLTRNPDGSITRKPKPFDLASMIPSSDQPFDPSAQVISKDITINQENKTWARVYLPVRPEPVSIPLPKLPIIIYFHGGGLVTGAAASSITDDFFYDMTSETPAVVVSVEYRLAPEHRVPAAYEDGVEALHVIKNIKEEWMMEYADLSKCFIMGTSAGGNIAYHVGLRVLSCAVDDFVPLKIQGLILHQPFFGGVERTPSEVRLANNKTLPVCLSDLMWELALPDGADRDHEYCNPTADHVNLEILEKMKDQGWRVLVTGYDGDPLVDRQLELVKVMEEKGVAVSGMFGEGGCHGYEIFDESKAKILHEAVKNFVLSA